MIKINDESEGKEMIKDFVEWLAWGFNGTKFGDKCWKTYEILRRREISRCYRRAQRR
jgi:hypothetical protein